ncbi:MAG: hypothetical protein ACLTMP_11625 [Eggerthella lenta]
MIANDDRHLGNFGFLFDNRTRSLVSLRPSSTTTCRVHPRHRRDLTASDLARSAAWYKSPSNVLLDYQAKRVMTDDLRDRLARLRGFEFAPHRLPARRAVYGAFERLHPLAVGSVGAVLILRFPG